MHCFFPECLDECAASLCAHYFCPSCNRIWSSVLWGWGDGWECAVGLRPQYFIADSIKPGLDGLFHKMIVAVLWPSTRHTTHTGHEAVIRFKDFILSVTPVTALPGLRTLLVPRDPPLPMSSLPHLALRNVPSANQGGLLLDSLPSPAVRLAVWNVLFHRGAQTIDFDAFWKWTYLQNLKKKYLVLFAVIFFLFKNWKLSRSPKRLFMPLGVRCLF